jgi:hypothetical protein
VTQRLFKVLLFSAVTLCVSVSAIAQEENKSVLPAQQTQTGLSKEVPVTLTSIEAKELEEFIHDFLKWKKWEDRWRNTVYKSTWTEHVKKDRKERPVPPTFLYNECNEMLPGSNGRVYLACQILESYTQNSGAETIRALLEVERIRNESQAKSLFEQRIHLDGLWPIASVDSYKYGGIFGVHLTILNLGRVEIFGAPGVMLMSLPDDAGGRQYQVGIDYGFSLRLFEVPSLYSGKSFVLNANVAMVKLLANIKNIPGVKTQTTIVGFSLTSK